ncbi:MAG TPA: DUF4402 domain-containing protein [Gammaproteobacteria bacterium]
MFSKSFQKAGLVAAAFTLSAPVFVSTAIAADNADAQATATIVQAIGLTNGGDLAFGSLVIDAATAGTVVIAADGTKSSTGGVTTTTAQATSAAQFTVTGTTGYAYTVTLPASASLSDGGTATMTVDTFTENSTGTLTTGSETFGVGGTLNVTAGQTAGTYTGTFNVSVAYN